MFFLTQGGFFKSLVFISTVPFSIISCNEISHFQKLQTNNGIGLLMKELGVLSLSLFPRLNILKHVKNVF